MTEMQSWPATKRATGQEALVLEVVSAMTTSLIEQARWVFSHARLSLAAQGVLAVAVGLAMIAWPSTSIAAMVLVFAVYAAADGLLSMLRSLAERDVARLVRGLIGVALAAATLAWRDVSAVVLVYVIAVWVIVMALFRVRGAVTSHRTNVLKAVLVLLALPSVGSGVTAVLSPGDGAPSVLMDIAVFQVINGLTIVGFALRTSSRATPGRD
jgi:uncharacterized membrane protein HdeD (DUF308 family)